MENSAAQEGIQRIKTMLEPWFKSLQAPAAAQENVLQNLLGIYARTEYGQQKMADQIGSLEDYRWRFPVMDYEDYKPLIQKVMQGQTSLLLDEEPLGWAITRGTTKGETKFIPMTPADLKLRVSAGRAVMNYVLQSGRFDIFTGVNLNLNFPSKIGTVDMGGVSWITATVRGSIPNMFPHSHLSNQFLRRMKLMPWVAARPSGIGKPVLILHMKNAAI